MIEVDFGGRGWDAVTIDITMYERASGRSGTVSYNRATMMYAIMMNDKFWAWDLQCLEKLFH